MRETCHEPLNDLVSNGSPTPARISPHEPLNDLVSYISLERQPDARQDLTAVGNISLVAFFSERDPESYSNANDVNITKHLI